jgi:hypothetical protein
MDNPRPVRRVEGVGDLRHDSGDLRDRQRTAGETRRERLALVVRHDDERLVIRIVDLVDRADVRVIERAGGTGLADEPRRGLPRTRGVGGQELHRHAPLQLGVFGQIDGAHAAGTDVAQDAVMGDCAADHGERLHSCSAWGSRRLPLPASDQGNERRVLALESWE